MKVCGSCKAFYRLDLGTLDLSGSDEAGTDQSAIEVDRT